MRERNVTGRTQVLCRSARIDLLVLDDWGLAPLGAARRRDILADRYGRRSIVVTSQMPVAEWHRQLEYRSDCAVSPI